MSALFNFFAGALALFYSWVHSYGFAIAALTVFVMAVTTPLTYKGTKSMLRCSTTSNDTSRNLTGPAITATVSACSLQPSRYPN